MKNIIPEKKSRTWFKILPIMIIIVTIILNFFYSFGTKQEFITKMSLVFLGISCVISIFICVFGYYGFKYFFMIIFIANIVAVIFASFSYIRNLSGWQDLIGTVIYIEIIVIGVILGFITEIIAQVLKNKKK
ncbi:hypothetical protein M2651_02665 [Clostridium sp. SYSU_GA19001]|uniref:hypothetical protein n=1 Tax=Clostridium caldaquaticum TaxID=2940653 RepID=UPI002077918E|nr:hypothetical protein [Clostridium caldaquaticum]MCM8709926.1 hypothetical protein [Clostridium caldaquaticum]